MDLNRTEPFKGVALTTIIDHKFKTSCLSLRFISKLDEVRSTANALAFRIISDSNSTFPDNVSFSSALDELYGASVSSNTYKGGDVQICSIGASWIDNKYAFGGEDVAGGTLDILRNCLLSPALDGDGFNKDNFRLVRRDELDDINAIINNKRSYAISKAHSLAFQGEPAAIRATIKGVSAVTPQSALEAFRYLLKTARVEAFYCSSVPDSRIESMITEIFSASSRDYQDDIKFRSKSPIKPETAYKTETMDIRQCKMVMTFKTDSDDIDALKVLSIILGETPVSRFFRIIREQQSLCYYCSSYSDNLKNVIVADCGIEYGNISRVRESILSQIEDIGSGNISDEELENAMMLLENSFESTGDSPGSLIGWYFDCVFDQSFRSPADAIKDYRLVNKARLVQMARSLKLDSVFTLSGKEDGCNE